jgi:hypothetical protein
MTYPLTEPAEEYERRLFTYELGNRWLLPPDPEVPGLVN